MAEADYRPLKDYVARAGGMRLAMHPQIRDQMVELGVEEFPFDATDDTRVKVLAARLRIRARERYGSLLSILIIGIIANLVSRLIIEWWRKHRSHKVLMYVWYRSAKSRSSIPPAVDSEEG